MTGKFFDLIADCASKANFVILLKEKKRNLLTIEARVICLKIFLKSLRVQLYICCKHAGRGQRSSIS